MAESRASVVGAYVELGGAAAFASVVGAYVELGGAAAFASVVGAYVEVAGVQARASVVGSYVEVELPYEAEPPTVYATAYGPHGIMVSLTYDGDDNPDGFLWQWSLNGTSWTTLGFTDVDTRYIRHHPLTPNTLYYYRAAAFKLAAGTYSSTVSARTLALADVASGVALWIDVRDSSNNKLGPGPLTEIIGWSNVRRLSRAGEFSVDFPATYARLHQVQTDGNPLLHPDRYLYCYGILDGAVTLIGAGIVKEIELTRRASGPPTIAVTGPDLLGELRQVTVYSSIRPWQFEFENSTDAPDTLITTYAVSPKVPASWTISGGDPTDTAVTAKFVHATVLGSLIDVGAKIGEYFRLGGSNNGRQLVWLGPPADFVDCGVRAELAVNPIAAEGNAAICVITDVAEIKDAWDLYTKAFAFGAGQGHDRLDLASVTIWPDGHRYRSKIRSISGNGTVVTVVTAEAHDLVLTEAIEIVGTVNFDGTDTVFTLVDDYSFSYSDPTVASEAVPSVSITSISGNGTVVTVVTSTAHNLALGERLEVTGTVAFDGFWTVFTLVSDTSFSYEDTTIATEATGTIYGDDPSGYIYGASTRTIDGESWSIDRDETSIENVTARTAYGRHHTALQFKEISPLSNSDADMATSANALWAATYHWLRTHDAPAQFYRLAVAKLNSVLYPGQLLRVVAKGYVEGVRYLNIDTDLTILEVTTQIGQGGVRTTGLVVSTVERWPANDGDQAASEFHQASVYQSLAQLGPSIDTISYRESIDDDTGANFYFWLGPEVALVNSVLVRFRCDKLRSTVKSVGGSSTSTESGGGATVTSASGGGATPTSASGGGSTETTDSGSGHTHEVDLADSTSGSAVYFAGVGTPPEGDLRTAGGGKINTSSTGSGHTHDVDIPSHTHNVTVPSHTHDVTVDDHTHDVTAAISTEYGIYEDPGSAYVATDLEFQVNGGAWRSDITNLGSSWYALDITTEIVATGLRPRQAANSVAVRVKSASYADKKVQVTAQIERRTVLQSIATI